MYSSGLTVMQCDLGCRFWLREEKKSQTTQMLKCWEGEERENSHRLHVGAHEPGLVFSAKASTCTECASNYTSHS